MAWGRWLQPTDLNKSRRSIKRLGDLLPPSPPAEKATARQDQAGKASTGDGAGDRGKFADGYAIKGAIWGLNNGASIYARATASGRNAKGTYRTSGIVNQRRNRQIHKEVIILIVGYGYVRCGWQRSKRLRR